MGRVTGGEVTSTYGTVVWDGIGTLRIRYGGTLIRTRLGERIVPIEALRAVEVTDAGLRLLLRDGADPLQSVTQPIELYDFPGVDHDAAEGIARDIGQALVRRDVPETAATAWLVAPPPAPDRIEGRDATLAVASGQLTFKYHRSAGRKKKALGDPWSVPLGDIVDVEWAPAVGLGARGFLRITTTATPDVRPKPKHDPAAMLTRRATEADALFFAARLLTRIRP
ncbi:uncharacterized protein DUF4429 [Kribbella sp. VKM Ac-2569]|uniref:DUF4429 domain-containing protein n=1 Tax=Kribbella sp. VKM Ac-2569 TaxID=2512220 RepID=UPI00102B6BCF|nr:DUF4429 domain-containing protein [Kribbella sp. VKM Ac-2569]RZT20339.1 uncharacterized protein DUF4429 [Kribbella sp. VKM Ac-2569]